MALGLGEEGVGPDDGAADGVDEDALDDDDPPPPLGEESPPDEPSGPT